ncbi:MAG: hypothetical protein Q8P02_05200, partial [Candidatus Micrarchaeota archaeon]|nr:hypothetical protein [Candidatus Micrarchaeota archaeon]
MNNVFAGMLLLIVVLGVAIFLVPPQPVPYADTYYGQLKAACAPGDGCCMGSVNNMESGGYKIAENRQCPNGFQRVAVKCPTAYSWCVPSPTPTPTILELPDCPQYTPPAPGWCADGTITAGKIDANGCRGHPQCERNEPVPEVVDAPVKVELAPGQTINACGENIRYAGMTRAPGTRSDWRHEFQLLDNQANAKETLTAFGTGTHKMASQTTGITILVNRIEDAEPYTAS